MAMEIQSVPWLRKLLSITTFFSACEVHTNEPKNECKMYCLDCSDQASCSSCVSSAHKDHRVIRIRRSSYHNVVRAREIYKLVDIMGIQAYVINSTRVVFLNKRNSNQPKGRNFGRNYKNNSQCWTCRKSISDPFCFCSLACKLAWIRENGSFVVSAKKEEKMRITLEEMLRTERRLKGAYLSTSSPRKTSNGCSTSRRKGIPCRAPFY